LILDLSTLTDDTLVTPNESFFIRTAYPDQLRPSSPWQISVRGLVERPTRLALADLVQHEQQMGVHLLECSGNGRHRQFGLMSAAEWSGIPVTRVLERLELRRSAARILISGFDGHSKPYRGSRAGASWIFTFAELEDQGAFLATRMNGTPLPKDHGEPVRLIVPGWYGCTCIKWVDEVAIVDDTEPATSQMKEFASRTHQDRVPKLARDFKPAAIDQAAMPIRVEKWLVGGDVEYRVIGILWGGARPTKELAIRFNPDTLYVPGEEYDHRQNATWTLWSHLWKPPAPGRYRIELRVDDPKIRTRRLDRGFYARSVELTEA
jgi:DMSO/TMAO reductase YedYZ molybdopterin-dependent catalytic subunit